MKYRKKPIVVEAIQWQPGVCPSRTTECLSPNGWRLEFTTIHGQLTTILPGEWIIKESDGVHWYPCKDDVFRATYDHVDE